MDSRKCAQDVVRCNLCKTAVGPMYCEICHVNLCKDCIERHFSDTSKNHKVMSFQQFLCSVQPRAQRESFPPDRSLLDVPSLITDIATGYKKLNRVSCLTDEKIWTRGEDNTMKLLDLHGKLEMSVRTMSGNIPDDITVIRNGDLLYIDYRDSSINLVSNTQIQTLIRLRGWRPRSVYSASSGDLLVFLESNDRSYTKVVRYSGSTEKQNIQWNDRGMPLYSNTSIYKYLTENRNLDICVADNAASAVVVVSASGTFRFNYTGHPSVTKKPFRPRGITTDRNSRILTADPNNHSIHIIDKDGCFLGFIDNCGLQSPWGLCLDSRDNLFVADRDTCRVKKIQYSK